MTDYQPTPQNDTPEHDFPEAELPREETVTAPLDEEIATEEESLFEEPATDYEAMAREDLAVLQSKFPTCRGITHIGELQNPLRYAELRDLGLSPEEAYLATNYARLSAYQKDNRSHLYSAIPKSAKGESIRADALAQARDLFGDLSDGELISLYRRATNTR